MGVHRGRKNKGRGSQNENHMTSHVTMITLLQETFNEKLRTRRKEKADYNQKEIRLPRD